MNNFRQGQPYVKDFAAVNEIRQKFEAWKETVSNGGRQYVTHLDAWRAAYEAGEIAMKEKAAALANSSAQILPPEHRVAATWIGGKIRALPLSGAEESKK